MVNLRNTAAVWNVFRRTQIRHPAWGACCCARGARRAAALEAEAERDGHGGTQTTPQTVPKYWSDDQEWWSSSFPARVEPWSSGVEWMFFILEQACEDGHVILCNYELSMSCGWLCRCSKGVDGCMFFVKRLSKKVPK